MGLDCDHDEGGYVGDIRLRDLACYGLPFHGFCQENLGHNQTGNQGHRDDEMKGNQEQSIHDVEIGNEIDAGSDLEILCSGGLYHVILLLVWKPSHSEHLDFDFDSERGTAEEKQQEIHHLPQLGPDHS